MTAKSLVPRNTPPSPRGGQDANSLVHEHSDHKRVLVYSVLQVVRTLQLTSWTVFLGDRKPVGRREILNESSRTA